jgi:hypothetical protein
MSALSSAQLADFAAQEQAMFDLLFDASLREHFAQSRTAALAGYGLSPAALQDFETIRLDALVLDAGMRTDMVLASISKVLPLSFCLLSSMEGGLVLLRQLLDASLMRTPPAERAGVFATRLSEQVDKLDVESQHEQLAVNAMLNAERGMARMSAARLKAAIENGDHDHVPVLLADWDSHPVTVAPYVSMQVLPQPYNTLKKNLCSTEGAGLWRVLNRTPVTVEMRYNALRMDQPRLWLARACISAVSACDPVVEHQTLEVSDGFASLMQYVNGSMSVNDLLAGLQQAGAEETMLAGVKRGFRQLLEAGMLLAAD